MSEIRQYLSQFDAAGPRAMAEMLRNPSPEQEQGLRIYVGTERYRRMRGLALRLCSRHRSRTIGKVVLIPDFMGTALSRIDWEGTEEPTPIWMSIPRLMGGQFDVLRLSDDGFSGADRRFEIVPTGVFKRDYGELILTLAQDWDVRVLWYDWRKDLRVAASSLESKLGEWYGVDQPVHLVGFGMGGLVARWFIHEYPDRWKAMWNEQGGDGPRQGGRLLLLGVPNQGTFLIPQILTGQGEITHRLDQVDQRQNHLDIVRTFRTFVSLYQLLPRPEEQFAHLYEPETYLGSLLPHGQSDGADDPEHYRTSPIPKGLFANARKFEAGLEGTIDARRTVAVSAFGIPTVIDYDRLNVPNLAKAWLVSKDGGDGIVPLQLARPDIKGVREYFIRDEHAGLISNPKVLSSLTRLLAEGRTDTLPDQPPAFLPGKLLEGSGRAETPATKRSRSLDEIGATHLASRSGYPEPDEPTVEEREVGERLTRDLCGGQAELLSADLTRVAPRRVAIEIGLIHGTIDQADALLAETDPQNPPVDALAVGLYVGEKPSGPTLKLDHAISKKFLERTGRDLTDDSPLPERDLILTQFALRGLIRGELGQPFFLTDPRVSSVSEALPGRLLAVVGMGIPGRFGVPELTVTVRELCWAIGRVGKKHLAVAALGTKDNNLSAAEAISGWVRGIMSALAGADIGEFHLQRLTLVIHEAAQIKPLQEAIMAEQRRYSQAGRVDSDIHFDINYKPHNPDELKEFQERAIKDAKEKVEKHKGHNSDWRPEPTRVTLGLSGSTYRYGAIKTGASVSEREITLPTKLVEEVCTELSSERVLSMQLERGQFLGQLILPEDLRSILATNAPLVMMLDSATARIPWEMVALPEAPDKQADDLSNMTAIEPEWYFLGTSRGFTRQLRTTFAPPPAPPPPRYRRLRVLVVADPARDAHLPGAELEGTEVADLFDRFNIVHEHTPNRVEVVRMFGPAEAKLTNVLREIMRRPYDVMHFAGHCVYDKDNPSASGWIFSDGGRLTANELRRIDRIPQFIFSNACESGVTPDRTDKRSVDLPPTFAESFFARGVANLVCTAWPVSDAAARQFALALYAALLGMREVVPNPTSDRISGRAGPLPHVPAFQNSTDLGEPDQPEPMVMYEAMRYARLAIADAPAAARTWGAYQHYGDPFFRLLDAEALTETVTNADGGTTSRIVTKDATAGSEIDTSNRAGTATLAPLSEPQASANPNDQSLTESRGANGNGSPRGPTMPDESAPTLTASLGLTAVAVIEQPNAATANAPYTEPRTEGRGTKRRPRRDQ